MLAMMPEHDYASDVTSRSLAIGSFIPQSQLLGKEWNEFQLTHP